MNQLLRNKRSIRKLVTCACVVAGMLCCRGAWSDETPSEDRLLPPSTEEAIPGEQSELAPGDASEQPPAESESGQTEPVATTSLAAGEDALARRATWQEPTYDEVEMQIREWLDGLDVPSDMRGELDRVWSDNRERTARAAVNAILQTAAMVDPRAKDLWQLVRQTKPSESSPDLSLFDDPRLPGVVRHNLRLAYGIWLANTRLYDESLEILGKLELEQAADPGALLFYRGANNYRLRQREPGIQALGQLLERESEIPVRFARVAKLMKSELEALKPDSLDEVAKLMDSIHVRLDHGRAGKRVRTEEDDVIAKLDKMIEKLEQQRQQQQQQQQSGQGGQNQPSSPKSDSSLPQMSAPGNVDPKDVDGPVDWGNLPPKEREEALQELGKRYPSHYRDVIEEYFRDLARKEVESP